MISPNFHSGPTPGTMPQLSTSVYARVLGFTEAGGVILQRLDFGSKVFQLERGEIARIAEPLYVGCFVETRGARCFIADLRCDSAGRDGGRRDDRH